MSTHLNSYIHFWYRLITSFAFSKLLRKREFKEINTHQAFRLELAVFSDIVKIVSCLFYAGKHAASDIMDPVFLLHVQVINHGEEPYKSVAFKFLPYRRWLLKQLPCLFLSSFVAIFVINRKCNVSSGNAVRSNLLQWVVVCKEYKTCLCKTITQASPRH